MNHARRLRPMPFWMSLLFFGIPTAIGLLSVYVVLPALDRAGEPTVWTYNFTLYGVLPLLLVASLVAYGLEGRRFRLADLRNRFRLFGLDRRDWLWTVGLLVVYVGGYLLLLPTAEWLAAAFPSALPEALPPSVDPRSSQTTIPTEYFGVPLQGNWGIALLFFVILVFNILGEELWWRGYILPRQELVHGRWTWLVHGLLWTLFHAPFWWNLIALLPSTLSLSYVVSRQKSTTPGLVAHLAMNGLGYLLLVLGVLGLGS